MYEVKIDFLNTKSFGVMLKNIEALYFMKINNIHCFWHEEDLVTITNKGWICVIQVQKKGFKNSITVLPELYKTKINTFSGICSDFIQKYK